MQFCQMTGLHKRIYTWKCAPLHMYIHTYKNTSQQQITVTQLQNKAK